jgi:ElaB/YqjD/DUF883 family membrane-anchored ribosome-binding protein
MQTTDGSAQDNCLAATMLGNKVAQFKVAEQELMDKCRANINENPIASIAMAVGVGFVLSQLLSCRKTVCLVVEKK